MKSKRALSRIPSYSAGSLKSGTPYHQATGYSVYAISTYLPCRDRVSVQVTGHRQSCYYIRQPGTHGPWIFAFSSFVDCRWWSRPEDEDPVSDSYSHSLILLQLDYRITGLRPLHSVSWEAVSARYYLGESNTFVLLPTLGVFLVDQPADC